MANKTIGTELKLTGEKEFNQQMKAVNNGLKTTKSDLAALSAEFDDNGNSMEALTAKNKLLQASVEQHEAKVASLRAQYEAAAASLGENSATTQKYKQQLNYATVALEKETAALEENAAALEAKQSATMDAIAQKAKTIFSGIGTAAGGVAKGVGIISAAAAAGVAAIGAGGVVAVTQLAGMAREAAEAAKAAQEAGETLTETQQQWLEYADQLDALDASVANAKSAIAGVLLPVLGDLSTEGAAFLNDFTRDMTAAAGNTEKQTQVLSDYIVKGAKLIKEKLPEYIATGKELFSGLKEGLSESGPELTDMGMDLVFGLLDGIIENAPELAAAATSLTEQLLQGLIEQGPAAVASGVQMVADICQGLAEAAPNLIPLATELVVQLFTALVENAPLLLGSGIELVLAIISGVLASLGEIATTAGPLIDSFIQGFADKMSLVNPIGADMVRGVWAGIQGATDWIYDKISGWVGGVLDWIKAKLGIASPSKVMADEVGVWMARGIGVGWEKEMAKVNKLMADSIDTSFDLSGLYPGSPKYRGRNYKTPAGKTVNLYITAKYLTEADITMLLDLVNRKLGEDL